MFRFKAKRRIGSRRIAGWPGPQREKKAQAPSEVPKSGWFVMIPVVQKNQKYLNHMLKFVLCT